jgi:ABC-type Fe3+/spermidine/putrescine transport system ATPase subunit
VATVELLGTTVRVRDVPAGIGAGDAVRVVARPEAIEVVPATTDARRATVVTHTYLGEKIDYDLRCGETSISAVRYNAGDAIPDGADVGLRFAEDALALLPGARP